VTMAHLGPALALGSQAIVLLVLGFLAALFAYLGSHGWRDRPLASGIVLLVIALLGWFLVGPGAGLLVLVGGIFVFLAGILYLVAR
jgi:hypothetical protein